MNNKTFRQRLAYEVIVFLGLMALLLFITRIWLLLFLTIWGIFIAVLVLLFKQQNTVVIIEPAATPEPLSRQKAEKDILRRAHCLIQQCITEEVGALHPSARWQWLTPNPISSIERDEPLVIVLNGAGGYRKALVSIHNLFFRGLVYETIQTGFDGDTPLDADPFIDPDANKGLDKDAPEDNEEPTQTVLESLNYEYLAFEWVDSHMLFLNNRSNEAIGEGHSTLLISSDELPERSSWQAICEQLVKNDFIDAIAREDGILVSLAQ